MNRLEAGVPLTFAQENDPLFKVVLAMPQASLEPLLIALAVMVAFPELSN